MRKLSLCHYIKKVFAPTDVQIVDELVTLDESNSFLGHLHQGRDSFPNKFVTFAQRPRSWGFESIQPCDRIFTLTVNNENKQQKIASQKERPTRIKEAIFSHLREPHDSWLFVGSIRVVDKISFAPKASWIVAQHFPENPTIFVVDRLDHVDEHFRLKTTVMCALEFASTLWMSASLAWLGDLKMDGKVVIGWFHDPEAIYQQIAMFISGLLPSHQWVFHQDHKVGELDEEKTD